MLLVCKMLRLDCEGCEYLLFIFLPPVQDNGGEAGESLQRVGQDVTLYSALLIGHPVE